MVGRLPLSPVQWNTEKIWCGGPLVRALQSRLHFLCQLARTALLLVAYVLLGEGLWRVWGLLRLRRMCRSAACQLLGKAADAGPGA